MLKRNVSAKLRVSAKLNLYKNTVVAVIGYASPCWRASRGDMRKLELLQRRATKLILPTIIDYKERLVYLEVLPIPLYLQMLDVLTLTKICWEDFISLKDGPRRGRTQTQRGHFLGYVPTHRHASYVSFQAFSSVSYPLTACVHLSSASLSIQLYRYFVSLMYHGLAAQSKTRPLSTHVSIIFVFGG